MVRSRSSEELWPMVPGKVLYKDLIPLVKTWSSCRVSSDAVCLVPVDHWVVLLRSSRNMDWLVLFDWVDYLRLGKQKD